MKVIKFGGSSVGSVDGILSVKKIAESQQEPFIVVVSALSGITDQLYATSKMASEGNENYLASYEEMVSRHYQLVDQVIPESRKAKTVEKLNEYFSDLTNISQGHLSYQRYLHPNYRHHCKLRRSTFVHHCEQSDRKCNSFRCPKVY